MFIVYKDLFNKESVIWTGKEKDVDVKEDEIIEHPNQTFMDFNFNQMKMDFEV